MADERGARTKKNHGKWWRNGEPSLAVVFVFHGDRGSGDLLNEEEEDPAEEEFQISSNGPGRATSPPVLFILIILLILF